jgi:ElaB/YqjD/DUF883 family membrane-anchored ribosome-binding protein
MDDEAEVIREHMEETREALTDKLQKLENQVADTVTTTATSVAETVENVTDTVKGTVQTVKDSVEQVVTSMRDTLDLRLQVERHPWGMFAGGVAVGFVGTKLVDRAMESRGGRFVRESAMNATREAPSSVLGWLASAYSDELRSLKALGIGTAIGVMRDMISQALPPELGAQVGDWVDSLTSKVGGRPIHGPVFSFTGHDGNGRGGSCESGRF